MKSKSKIRIAGLAFALVAAATAAAVVYVQSRTVETDAIFAIQADSIVAPSAMEEIADPLAALDAIAVAVAVPEAEPSKETAAVPRNTAERLEFSLSPVQRDRLLKFINEGTPRELLEIHGVGKTRAEAIETARPFESVAQLAKVNGVGKVTYAHVIEFGKTLGDREAVVAVVAPSNR